MKPTVLFLFNSSDYAPAPWIADGRFNVVSIDYDDTDHSGTTRTTAGDHVHLNIDLSAPDAFYNVMVALTDLDYGPIGFIWSFAPCTSLAVSGAAWFKSKALVDPDFQKKAIALARIVEAVRPAGDSPLHTKLGGKSARTKYIRSLTPRGLALGVYHTNVSIALRVAGW